MATEDKWMVVYSCDRRGCCCANMGEDGLTGSIGTDAAEIRVVEGRLSILVESGMFGCVAIVVEIGGGRGVPRYAEAVDVE